jgi:two-component sensor histidine kinase
VDLPTPPDPQAALSLALAVVAVSESPLLLLDGDLNVIEASGSFYRAFQVDPQGVRGRSFLSLGTGEWDLPELRSLLGGAAATDSELRAYEMNLDREGREPRRLVLNCQKLNYANESSARLILSISDVTEARASDRLRDSMLREKAILLQEIQHRVADSLKVVAAVLLHSVRNLRSEGTRQRLYDVDNRSASIDAVEQQLVVSQLGDVELRPYLTDLCDSLAGSLVGDRTQLSLAITADGSVAKASDSVSLGLIVTELVINALKHAFPGCPSGRILVDYRSMKRDWTLSVSDNGVGMPTDPESAKPGLGSTIVEALAKRLQATIQLSDAHPGLTVSVVHLEATGPPSPGEAA